MRRPFPDMDYYASFPAFTAIPQAKDNPETYGKHPLATGPYKFADYKPGSELTLVKNDQWDPDTDPGRIQAVDGWDFKFGQDTAKLENVIINDQGSAQTTLTYDNVTAVVLPVDLVRQGPPRDRHLAVHVHVVHRHDRRSRSSRSVRRSAGPTRTRRLGRPAARSTGLTRVPGTAILPPGTAGRVDYQALDGQDGKTTDPAKAKELLEEGRQRAGRVRDQVPVRDRRRPRPSPRRTRSSRASRPAASRPPRSPRPSRRSAPTAPTTKSPINVRSSGWCSDWPTGGSWFPAQWAGSLVGLEGMPNPANFKEADMDKQQDKILDTMTPEEAATAWGEFDKTMETKYYPAVNTGYSGTAMIHGSKIGGMDNDNVRGMPTFARMYITK